MSNKLLTLSFWMIPVAIVSACSLLADPQGRRVVGIVGGSPPDGSSQVITAPDTIQAGIPFTATITTFAPYNCWRAAGADIDLRGNLAVVIPYDFDPRSDDFHCPDMEGVVPRPVEIRFAEPGEATLRVRGREAQNSNILINVEKRIFVR